MEFYRSNLGECLKRIIELNEKKKKKIITEEELEEKRQIGLMLDEEEKKVDKKKLYYKGRYLGTVGEVCSRKLTREEKRAL